MLQNKHMPKESTEIIRAVKSNYQQQKKLTIINLEESLNRLENNDDSLLKSMMKEHPICLTILRYMYEIVTEKRKEIYMFAEQDRKQISDTINEKIKPEGYEINTNAVKAFIALDDTQQKRISLGFKEINNKLKRQQPEKTFINKKTVNHKEINKSKKREIKSQNKNKKKQSLNNTKQKYTFQELLFLIQQDIINTMTQREMYDTITPKMQRTILLLDNICKNITNGPSHNKKKINNEIIKTFNKEIQEHIKKNKLFKEKIIQLKNEEINQLIKIKTKHRNNYNQFVEKLSKVHECTNRKYNQLRLLKKVPILKVLSRITTNENFSVTQIKYIKYTHINIIMGLNNIQDKLPENIRELSMTQIKEEFYNNLSEIQKKQKFFKNYNLLTKKIVVAFIKLIKKNPENLLNFIKNVKQFHQNRKKYIHENRKNK
jgi:hypothetical protein